MLAPRGRLFASLALFAIMSVAVNFPEGYTNSYPNTAVVSFQNMINQSFLDRGVTVSPGVFTWIWSATLNIWFVGYLIGTFLTPPATEKLGRKNALLLANGISLLGAVLNLSSTLFSIPEMFIIGRGVSSIGSGISFGGLILFLQEVSPTQYRGITSFMCETAFLLNTVLGIFCGMDIALGQQLPYLTGLSIIPALVAIVIIMPLKETPKYLLLKKHDVKSATESVLYYHGDVEVSLVLAEIEKEQETELASRSVLREIFAVFREPHLRTAFLVGMFTLQLIVSFWPITYLSTAILGDVFPSAVAQYTSLLFIVSNFTAALLGLAIVEKFGRRPLVLILGLVNTLSLVFYVICDQLSGHAPFLKYGTIIALVVFGVSYGVGLGPIAFFLTSELVSQQQRSLVQSLVYALNAVICLAFSSATLPLYNMIGSYCFLPLFVIPGLLSLVYLYFYLPETKDREVHDIVKELVAKGKSNVVHYGSIKSTSLTTMTKKL